MGRVRPAGVKGLSVILPVVSVRFRDWFTKGCSRIASRGEHDLIPVNPLGNPQLPPTPEEQQSNMRRGTSGGVVATVAATACLICVAVPKFIGQGDVARKLTYAQGGVGVLTVTEGGGEEAPAIDSVEAWAASHALFLLASVSSHEQVLLLIARDESGKAVYILEDMSEEGGGSVGAATRARGKLLERVMDQTVDWSPALSFFVRAAAELRVVRRIAKGLSLGQFDVCVVSEGCLAITF